MTSWRTRTEALRLALLLALSLAPSARAADRTLAVLPFEKGAGSAEYDGLGKALAGMFVADLANVEGLALVERERLDALLAEMDLGESGFLDPKTAQTLGRGIGAEMVLSGSYSVVGTAFVMDARVVRVESGEIAEAARGEGAVGDFVSVQKQVVEGLLEGLEISLTYGARRAILAQVPTESFDAFTAWAEGVARTDAGDTEAARTAFERAVAADPEFAAAREALASLRAQVESVKEARVAAASETQRKAEEAILADHPDERTRGRGFEDDVHSLVGFALRLDVLANQGADCQRAEEMWHYLDRVGWVVPRPPRDEEGVFEFHCRKKAEAYGFDAWDDAVPGGPKVAYDAPSNRSPMLWRSTESFLMHGTSGLAASITRCHEPDARIAEYQRLRKKIDQEAKAHPKELRGPRALSISETLWLEEMETVAETRGADPSFEKAFDAMRTAHEGDEKGTEALLDRIDDIVDAADEWEERHVRRVGASEAELERAMRGFAAEDASVVRADANPICAAYTAAFREVAQKWVASVEKARAEDPGDLPGLSDRAGAWVAVLRDAGCLVGTPARFSGPSDVAAHVSTAADRKDARFWETEKCVRGRTEAEEALALLETHAADHLGPYTTAQALLTYYQQLVHYRCVEFPP